MRLHWGVLFSLMIVGMLRIISTRLKNRAAFVNRESSPFTFFGSHIESPNTSPSNWLQSFGFRNERILDPVFILRSVVAVPADPICSPKYSMRSCLDSFTFTEHNHLLSIFRPLSLILVLKYFFGICLMLLFPVIRLCYFQIVKIIMY